MKKSKNKSKPAGKIRLVESSFAIKAARAMRMAQKEAAKECARYGLPLIVEKTPR